MRFHLTCQEGGSKGQSWGLQSGIMLLGRGKECDIVVPDPTISRAHCKFVIDDDSVTLSDLDSANGTQVNGDTISEQAVKLGDQLIVGAIPFLLVSGDDPAPTATEETESIFLTKTDSVLLNENMDPSEITDNPDTVMDLSSIGWLARELSQAKSRDELIKVLVRRIRRRLSPVAIHLIDFRSEEPSEQQLFGKQGHPCLPPEKRMEFALPMLGADSEPKGQSAFVHDNRQMTRLATVPIIFTGEAIAVMSVEIDIDSLPDDERFLDFLLAAATTFAPFLQAIERIESLREQNRNVSRSGNGTIFAGESTLVCDLLKQVDKAANVDLNVLISGETGVGKELVARLLHEHSPSSDGPFVAVNCAAMTSELFLSELFGHEKGAYSGAYDAKVGFAELANGGTLFLDEVGDLTAQNQAALLRFIETKSFFTVGGRKEICTDSKVVAATNKNLKALVGTGNFRLDLYHRLSAVSLHVPPLRERREDIPIIAELFYDQALKYARRPLLGLTEDGLQHLRGLDWPGNARELKNVIERAVAFAADESITGDDLREIVSDAEPEEVAVLFDSTPTLEQLEKNYIERVYLECGENGVKASKVLGIPKSTMYDKLAYYGISGPRSKKN